MPLMFIFVLDFVHSLFYYWWWKDDDGICILSSIWNLSNTISSVNRFHPDYILESIYILYVHISKCVNKWMMWYTRCWKHYKCREITHIIICRMMPHTIELLHFKTEYSWKWSWILFWIYIFVYCICGIYVSRVPHPD